MKSSPTLQKLIKGPKTFGYCYQMRLAITENLLEFLLKSQQKNTTSLKMALLDAEFLQGCLKRNS